MTKAPALVVTELAPDTANIGGSDAWEFIEIYNNSSRDIDLKDYRLYYYYPDNGNNALWWNTTESKILKSGEAMVFWVDNGKNSSQTLADFNEHYGSALDRSPVD